MYFRFGRRVFFILIFNCSLIGFCSLCNFPISIIYTWKFKILRSFIWRLSLINFNIITSFHRRLLYRPIRRYSRRPRRWRNCVGAIIYQGIFMRRKSSYLWWSWCFEHFWISMLFSYCNLRSGEVSRWRSDAWFLNLLTLFNSFFETCIYSA